MGITLDELRERYAGPRDEQSDAHVKLAWFAHWNGCSGCGAWQTNTVEPKPRDAWPCLAGLSLATAADELFIAPDVIRWGSDPGDGLCEYASRNDYAYTADVTCQRIQKFDTK